MNSSCSYGAKKNQRQELSQILAAGYITVGTGTNVHES
jgi:hypothetical protein